MKSSTCMPRIKKGHYFWNQEKFWALFLYKHSILKCTWLFIPPPHKYLIRQSRQFDLFPARDDAAVCSNVQEVIKAKEWLPITHIYVRIDGYKMCYKRCYKRCYKMCYKTSPGPEQTPAAAAPSAGPARHGPSSPGELLTGETGNWNSSARHRDYEIILTKVTKE